MLSTPAEIYLLVGGVNVTGDIYSMAIEEENLIEETHTFGDSYEESTPIGIARLSLSTGEGLYDDRLNGQLEAFRDAPTNTTQLCMILLAGDDPQDPAIMLDGIYTVKYTRTARKDGLTMANAEHVVNVAARVNALVVHGFTEVTANGNTEAALTETDVMFPEPSSTITTTTVANDVVTTALNHGFNAGDYVFITGHAGSTPSINSTAGTAGELIATVPALNEFTLDGVAIAVAGTGGTAKKAKGVPVVTSDTDEIITTSVAHRFSVGDKIFFVGHVGATPALNGAAYGVGETILTVPSSTTFTIAGPISVGGTGGVAIRIGIASAYADLHVPALTLDSATNVVVTVRHSDESATNYTNAVAFTAVTAVDAAERKTITDLKRFRAVNYDWTGGAGANSTVQIVSAVEISR